MASVVPRQPLGTEDVARELGAGPGDIENVVDSGAGPDRLYSPR